MATIKEELKSIQSEMNSLAVFVDSDAKEIKKTKEELGKVIAALDSGKTLDEEI